jgi:hypothetical protein
MLRKKRMNVYELENIIEEHGKMKKELARRQALEHQKAIMARSILDDESLIYDLIKCIQKLESNNILTKIEATTCMDMLHEKFASKGIYFVKPFYKRKPRYE